MLNNYIVPIVVIIILVFGYDLLLLFGASENTIEYATRYMNIYAIGTIFVQLTLGMNSYITCQGYSKVSMFTVLIGAIFNIILDPIFIFIFNSIQFSVNFLNRICNFHSPCREQIHY